MSIGVGRGAEEGMGRSGGNVGTRSRLVLGEFDSLGSKECFA